MSEVVGLRVDVDFGVGLRKGVPYLLSAFRKRNLRVTFYITMGPDGFRKHTQRLGSPSYRNRVRRMSPWSIVRKFGPTYLIRQAAGIPDKVGARYPDVIRMALDQGHEVGVHGYDHYWWAENVFGADRTALKRDMDLAFGAFRESTGRDAMAWASPNWRCSAESLTVLDECKFPYGADTRGRTPFVPATAGRQSTTPQLPISLPCLHEIADYLATTDSQAITREFASRVTPGYNVWCIHDYYEGLLRRDVFEPALDGLIGNGWPIVAMDALARQIDRATLPVCEVVRGRMAGGRGEVSCQGEEVSARQSR